jgi:hypothetical protein
MRSMTAASSMSAHQPPLRLRRAAPVPPATPTAPPTPRDT